MHLGPYRRVLALPGVRALMLVALIARIPATATAMALTLHVVLNLDGTYAQASAAAATRTFAAALGAPLVGRLIDRVSLRAALALTTLGEAIFWAAAPHVSYPALLAASGVLGLLGLPVFSVVRQSIAALVPEAQRRQAYALDSMSVELSFMLGPALAVVMVTHLSAFATMSMIGGAIVLSSLALYAFNPPVRSVEEKRAPAQRVSHRSWLRPRFLAFLVMAVATTVVLAGSDIALVANLRAADQVGWLGPVIAMWCAYSLVGGFVYGAVRRAVPLVALLALLGALTIPVGLGDGAMWLAIALLPAGALCAPTLAAGTEAVSRIVPAEARGEAMGMHNSAITLGVACGGPLAGAVIDATSPAWGFAVVGAVGLVTALLIMPFWRNLDGTASDTVHSGLPDKAEQDVGGVASTTVASGVTSQA